MLHFIPTLPQSPEQKAQLHFSFIKTSLIIALLLTGFITPMVSQVLSPTVRFHKTDSPYHPYFDNLLSGFMQNAHQSSSVGGFLQMPFVGDPALVYIGEKDTTQFMAYASAYEMQKDDEKKHFSAYLTRYEIHAEITQMPTFCIQQYTFPDTLTSKGFLLDIDNASNGKICEDMDIVFLDRQTIRAYKRSLMSDTDTPDLFYVAHFSHPFHQWNIRREVVTLENGQKEKRCKAAFVFDIGKGDKLTVKSYVSSLSTNEALVQLNLKNKGFKVSDKRMHTASTPSLIAQNTLSKNTNRKANSSEKSGNTSSSRLARNNTYPQPSQNTNSSSTSYNSSATDIIDISTRDAELKAAFSIALSQIKKMASKHQKTDALALIDFITTHYAKATSRIAHTSVASTDSLIRKYANQIFAHGPTKTSIEETAWFLFNAMGFVPDENSINQSYRLVRPMFNVVTLRLPRGRRFIIHCKRNSTKNLYIETANMIHQAPLDSLNISRSMLTKGGILELKMSATDRHKE